MSAPIHIDSRGYGKIYKSVMRCRTVPLLAKAIYSYFCTYAGSGTKAYPRREKIVRDLQINKDTFTKHLNMLVAEGYIGKERTSTGNLYTIIQTVPGHSRANQDNMEAVETDLLVMENVQAQGFGTVPKIVMLDRRLSAQAKAIYAYFASFAGAGTTAFPRRTTVMRELGMSERTYYRHFNKLLDARYISVEQRKVKGKFDVSLYRLAETVASPSLPPPGEGKPSATASQNGMSEKGMDGEKSDAKPNNANVPSCTGLSEKVQNGGEVLKTANLMSEKGMTGKVQAEKIRHEEPGQPNIKNRSITNISLDKEQEYNHQGGVATEDDGNRCAFSLEQAKRIISYGRLLDNALAWGELKETLHQYEAPGDKARYMIRAREIADALAAEVQKRLAGAERPEQLTAVLQSEAFEELVDELLYRWDSMRSVQSYVARSLDNLLGSG